MLSAMMDKHGNQIAQCAHVQNTDQGKVKINLMLWF